MSSSASPPHTPSHSRNASTMDTTFDSPQSYGDNSARRLSKASMHSHSPSYRHSMRSDSIGDDYSGAGGVPAANGLGNLADELAEAWTDEGEGDEEEPEMNFQEPARIPDSPVQRSLQPPAAVRGHRRQVSEYDGSDYGDDSDLESPGIPPGLQARMDMVESLVRRGTENNGSDRDEVVQRVVEGLKDLGSQTGIEGGASRLITAHTALSSHLLHQTRLLQGLAYPLFSPLSVPPDPEFIDELMPMLVTIGDSIPQPTTAAFTQLTQLHGLTNDLVQTLNLLSDSLYMSRQTTLTATRRLKSARELVAEMRKEEDAREEGERWLAKGNWSERLGARECAGVCGDVVGGFEAVCNDWRARLEAQAEAVGA